MTEIPLPDWGSFSYPRRNLVAKIASPNNATITAGIVPADAGVGDGVEVEVGAGVRVRVGVGVGVGVGVISGGTEVMIRFMMFVRAVAMLSPLDNELEIMDFADVEFPSFLINEAT